MLNGIDHHGHGEKTVLHGATRAGSLVAPHYVLAISIRSAFAALPDLSYHARKKSTASCRPRRGVQWQRRTRLIFIYGHEHPRLRGHCCNLSTSNSQAMVCRLQNVSIIRASWNRRLMKPVQLKKVGLSQVRRSERTIRQDGVEM